MIFTTTYKPIIGQYLMTWNSTEPSLAELIRLLSPIVNSLFPLNRTLNCSGTSLDDLEQVIANLVRLLFSLERVMSSIITSLNNRVESLNYLGN